MGTKWTPERRAQFEAEKAAKQTSVAVLDRPLLGESEFEDEPEIMAPGQRTSNDGASIMGRSELFKARMRSGKAVTTEDDVEGLGAEERQVLDGGAAVSHTSAGLVWMYKREIWGWRRLKVSRNSAPELIDAGFLDRCGNCGSTSCPGEINQCPKTAKVQYRDCPVAGCNQGNGHRVYDDGLGLSLGDENDDPFAIRDDTYKSTPETRTKAMLEEHIRWYHPQTAAYMGITVTGQQMAV